MAMKVIRTFGIQVVLEKCGCKVQRDYEDTALKTALDDAVYTPCPKHKAKKDAAETIELILSEYLETKAQEAAAIPVEAPRTSSLGHSVADIAAANRAGAESAVRTPIKKPGAVKPGVRRAGEASSSTGPTVSRAVAEARAAGSAFSLDAELARAPEPQGGGRLGPISRAKVAEVIDEADGEPVTPLDVILGVNDTE